MAKRSKRTGRAGEERAAWTAAGGASRPPGLPTWALQDAKARLSELVRRARRDGPQRVTTRGGNPVVVLPEEEYRRLTSRPRKVPKLTDVLRACPGGELRLGRSRDMGRAIRFD